MTQFKVGDRVLYNEVSAGCAGTVVEIIYDEYYNMQIWCKWDDDDNITWTTSEHLAMIDDDIVNRIVKYLSSIGYPTVAKSVAIQFLPESPEVTKAKALLEKNGYKVSK